MASLLRLVICVSGVYAAFLLWAIAQERLSAPFPLSHAPAHANTHAPHQAPDGARVPGGDKFPSPLFFNWCQALAGASCSAAYLIFGAWRRGELRRRSVGDVLGLTRLRAAPTPQPKSEGRAGGKAGGKAGSANGSGEENGNGKENGNGHASVNGNGNGSAHNGSNGKLVANSIDASGAEAAPRPWYQTLAALLIQVSLFQTTAGPIGFHALRHISYPTMVLGKSCKLIPVLLLNVLIYRRRFGAHKYAVVGLVTAGISLFMLYGKSSKGKGGDSVWGLTLLLVNLFIDGLTNSTQDQIFTLYPGYSGQQMMFIMASMTLVVLTPAMLVPLPSSPLSLLSPFIARFPPTPLEWTPPILVRSVAFVASHPTALSPLLAYAALGGLGQIFIFETIQHFGSLTLVMVTVTRKLFTMLLSVAVFGHRLALGQWVGVAVVFAGIGVEAACKMQEKRRVKKAKSA